jgi:hypothetical protein
MTDTTTNPGDGEAMPEVVDALAGENEALDPNADTQDDGTTDEGDDGQPAEDFEQIEFDGETFNVPKKLKDGFLRQADYTKKTQEVAAQRQAIDMARQSVHITQQRQAEFAQDIANLGAFNARLEPFNQVNDWPSYIRNGGAQAQADYMEYQALVQKRDQFANGVAGRIQQRAAEEERETANLVQQGRAEIAKHIPGYTADTVTKLADFGTATYGFNRDFVLQAEADPGSIRALHDAFQWRQHLAQQKRTSTLAQGQQTKPVQTLRGSGGRIVAKADTNDFAAFERMADERLAAKR